MAVMGSPHGFVVLVKNKLTMFGAHCPFIPLDQLAESKVSFLGGPTVRGEYLRVAAKTVLIDR